MLDSLVERALADFNHGEEFYTHLSEDVVLEFPYGPSLGLPDRTAGKEAVTARVAAAQASGLQISNVVVAAASAGTFFVEYVGTYRGSAGSTARVPLVAVIKHDGTAITLIREYWDTLRIAGLADE